MPSPSDVVSARRRSWRAAIASLVAVFLATGCLELSPTQPPGDDGDDGSDDGDQSALYAPPSQPFSGGPVPLQGERSATLS